MRRNLREYSKEFDELDKELEEGANIAIVEGRRTMYREWCAWVEKERELVRAEGEELGLANPLEELELQRTKSIASEGEQVVEEVFDELIEETEEFV